MRQLLLIPAIGLLMLAGVAHAQDAAADCTKLKGKARASCQARAAAAQPATAAPVDKFPFPEEQSKGTAEERKPATGDMPTSGVADPPAESMRPLKRDGTPDDTRDKAPDNTPDKAPPGVPGSGSSSSSSSSSDDDDVAPTTSAGDTPVKAATLKDLGSHADSSAARAKLEVSRVEDDLKIGRFYFKDGNYSGATARYKDALDRDADNPDAHFGLAEVLVKQNKRDEAVTHLQRYLALAPDEDHSKDARRMLAKLREH